MIQFLADQLDLALDRVASGSDQDACGFRLQYGADGFKGARVMALAAGDSWLEKGATALLSGPPGAG